MSHPDFLFHCTMLRSFTGFPRTFPGPSACEGHCRENKAEKQILQEYMPLTPHSSSNSYQLGKNTPEN